MIKIRDAESRFNERHGRYAELRELGDQIAADQTRGYRFELTLTNTGYRVEANPIVWHDGHRRSFLLDETGTIHQSWEHRRATITDRAVE